MITILQYLFISLQIITAIFLLFPVLNVFLSAFIKVKKPKLSSHKESDLGIIITAYKDVTIALPLIESILDQTYKNYIIYLVADQCSVSGLKFSDERVKVLDPKFPLGSKVRSIKYACENFIREHEFLTVFDPDNLAHPDFFHITNEYLNRGYQAVQGRRTAKNVDSVYACLDAMGEYYYNYVVRYVPFGLGSSSSIAGSGMTISAKLYTDFFKNEEVKTNFDKVIIAEDKILQANIISKGHRIAFANEALVFDEKVSSGLQVERQRTRWINSYFKYAKVNAGLMANGIKELNWNKFYFGMNNFLPPLFLIMLFSCMFLFINLFTDIRISSLWLAGLSAFVLNFIFVLYISRVEKEIWHSFWGIPMFMFNQVSALFKIKRSDKDFLVTEHSKFLTIEDVMSKRKGYSNKNNSSDRNKKIKILQTIRQGSFGGGETYLFNLVCSLDKKKYEPVVLSFTEGNMVDKLRELGIKTYVIENLLPYNVFKFNAVKKIIRDENIEIVHMHGTRAASNTLFPAKALNKKIIYTAHGWSFSSSKSLISEKLRRLSEKNIVANSDFCICGSEADIETGKAFKTNTEFELIRNSIDTEYYNRERTSTHLKDELSLMDNTPIVSFIGRIEYQKDPLTFIKAIPEVLNNFPDVKFFMAGEGSLKQSCINEAAMLNIEKNIIFLPFTDDVRSFLAISDIFVLPSLWEVIPLALLEAMSMECCCVATDIEGTREAITNMKNGLLISRHSVYELSTAIILVLSSNELRSCLSKNARLKVKKDLDLKRLIQKNEIIYSKLTGQELCEIPAALTG
ncbi:hypothetical protein BH10BAC5_BH10BAC5_16300 [soil metagenome]